MNKYKITNPSRFIAGICLFLMLSVVSFLGIGALVNRQNPAVASIPIGNSYQSTSTDATWSGANTWKMLKSGAGTFGSIVVTLGSTAPICVYDATTTVNGAIYGTTTLACFKTTATAGTYTFDSAFRVGLVVDSASSVGVASTTATFR